MGWFERVQVGEEDAHGELELELKRMRQLVIATTMMLKNTWRPSPSLKRKTTKRMNEGLLVVRLRQSFLKRLQLLMVLEERMTWVQ
jgi:hypothetical protein